MLLLLLLLSRASSFNIDTNKYSVLKGGTGEFGFSVAVTADHVFVAAPKAEERKGAVFHCDRKSLTGEDNNRSIEKSDVCTEMTSLPRSGDQSKVDETDQGLGETLTLSPSKKKLVICAPRRKARPYGFCEMANDEKPRMMNVRGVCYELDVDSWNSPSITTLDHCKGTEWKTLASDQDQATLETFNVPLTSSYTCLQLDLSSWDSSSGPPFQGSGLEINVTSIDNEKDILNFSMKLSNWGEPQKFQCNRDGLGFGRIGAEILRVYCKGSRLGGNRNINVDTMNLDLTGPALWWEEGFGSYLGKNGIEGRKKKLLLLGSCMLGHSAWFDSEDSLVLSAPGYKLKSGSYSGSLFFGDNMMDSEGEMKDIEEKGSVYRSIRMGDDTWSALTGITKGSSRIPAHCVLILKNKALHSRIKEESRRGGFGKALAFWTSGSVVQLVISAPYTTQHGQLDCGVLYVYKLQSDQFRLEFSVGDTSSCGGFGASVVDIGDLDGDGFTDIAVGSTYGNSVHIIRGGSGGLQQYISQIIRPQEELVKYENIFGFAISGHKGLLGISDPSGNNVYLYRSLDVLELSSDISECAGQLDIDTQESVSCKVCVSLTLRDKSPSSISVSVTVSWIVSNKNITERRGKRSTAMTLSHNKCLELELTRQPEKDIRFFDLTEDVTIDFSFSQGPDPLEGRVVAVAPESLKGKTLTISTTGKCGKSFCKADFEIAVDWRIERNNLTEIFEVISNKTLISDKKLYFGSGKEVLVLNITVRAVEGSFTEGKFGEQLSIEFGEKFKVPVPHITCSNVTEENKISIDVTENNTCSVGVEECADEFSCSKAERDGSGDKRSYLVRAPVVGGQVYSENKVQVKLAVITRRSLETDLANNVLTVNVGVVPVLDLGVVSTLEPSEVVGMRVRNFKASSKTLQRYGPVQTLTISLENRGSPTIAHTEASVLYPVHYHGQEMIYIAEISGSTNCSSDTDRAVNYRQLRDVYSSGEESNTEKFSSLPLEECSGSWKCLNLTCSVFDIAPGKKKSLVIKTYLNAGAASQYPNISYSVSYHVTHRDSGSVYPHKTITREIGSTVEVIPSLEGALWYIVAGVGGGSLLLVLLVLLLVKCGFFSRKDRDQIRLLRNETAGAAVTLAPVEEMSSEKRGTLEPPDHVPEPPHPGKQ